MPLLLFMCPLIFSILWFPLESDILQHEEWYRQMRLISNRQKECIVAYESARAELVEQASEQLRALRHNLVRIKPMQRSTSQGFPWCYDIL